MRPRFQESRRAVRGGNLSASELAREFHAERLVGWWDDGPEPLLHLQHRCQHQRQRQCQ